MRTRKFPYIKKIHSLFLGLLMLAGFSASAQEKPPVPVAVEVNTSQFLNFGAFTIGTGTGEVSVDHNGTRTSTGDVFLLNVGEQVSPALFDITANPGTILNIVPDSNIILQGSNGGELKLKINSFSTGEVFISKANPPHVNSVYVGGTLTLENASANPPGRYNGTFSITVIQQ